MLVLSRKVGERITMRLADGREVTIWLTSINCNGIDVRGGGYKARLGVEAPDDVIVFREEVRHLYEGGRSNDGNLKPAAEGGDEGRKG